MLLRGCLPANWPEGKKSWEEREDGMWKMCKSSKSLDCRGFDWCSFSCLSVAVANEAELYWISQQNYFDRDQMWACGCICQISWNTLHRGYSHFLLTVEGQMIPGLVLAPVGIKLTHCNFEWILFVGVMVYWFSPAYPVSGFGNPRDLQWYLVSVSSFSLSGLNDCFRISCSMSIWLS